MGVTLGLVLTVILTVSGASFQFYSFAVLNTPQLIVEKWINDTFAARNGKGFTKSALTLFWSFTVGAVSIGAFCGSLLTRTVAESCGRRNGLISTGILTCIGGTLAALSKTLASPELLILGRAMLGMTMGITSGLAPMYLTEIAPMRYRGATGSSHQIAVAFGDWFSLLLSLPEILGSESLWPIAVGFPAIPAFIMVVMLPFCHESPRFLLISRGKRVEARKALDFFVEKDDAKPAFEELVRQAAIRQLQKRHRTIEIFQRKRFRAPLFISMLVMVAQQFTGAAAIFAYSSQIFMQADLSTTVARYCTLAIGICYFMATLPTIYLIERLGRRNLSLFQLTGCLCCLSMLSVFVGLQQDYAFQWASYGSIGSLVAYMLVYGVGSPIPWMIASELFAIEYRSAAVTVSTFTAWFWSFFISTFYLAFAEWVGVTYSFLPFIGVLSVSIIGMALLLPETRNKSIDEIVEEFRKRSRTLSIGPKYDSQTPRPSILTPLIEEDESATPVRGSRHSSYNAVRSSSERHST